MEGVYCALLITLVILGMVKYIRKRLWIPSTRDNYFVYMRYAYFYFLVYTKYEKYK